MSHELFIDPCADLLHELSLPTDAAELRELVELCRRSVRIRSWLFGRFANEPYTRECFRNLLNGDASASPWAPVLTDQILSAPSASTSNGGPHGGLSEQRVVALIKRYQAGRIDTSAFVYVLLWFRLGISGGSPSIALGRPTLRFWASIMRDPTGRLAREIGEALRFLHDRSDRTIGAADFGFTATWRIHVLIYILDYPKPRYRVGELRDNLPVKYRHVGRKEIREFCKEHGICRDTRPGERPASERDAEMGTLPTPAEPSRFGSVAPSGLASSLDDSPANGSAGGRVIGTIRSKVSPSQRNAAAFRFRSPANSGPKKKDG